ncbi:hypothetical protein [Butyrivibrio sp. AE2005]|uniref:hypothetical protein n=1 Tax=Butyrivibrio sp. AE2005 TaxID=1496722 RepID=UPI00047E4661|nr:hypothetical protein [Butyrivibrio sp. AE2005]
MSNMRTQDFWTAVANVVIFGLLVTTFFILLNLFVIAERKEVGASYTKDAVTDYPKELTQEEKDLIKGSSVLAEAISYSDGTYIKINGTVVSDLIVAATGEDYITYAKKYGTGILDNYISIKGKYKKEVALNGDGAVSGVSYTLVY